MNAVMPDYRGGGRRGGWSLMHTHVVHLFAMSAVIAVGCASSGDRRPEPFPRVADRTATGARMADRLALTETALSLTGVPYAPGGDSPRGFDCSGFTRYVFGLHGIALPRQAHEQYQTGRPVGGNDVQPGDLVFFTTVAPGASHVGVVIDRQRFVHAPNERGKVRVERLGDPYWRNRYLGARRMLN